MAKQRPSVQKRQRELDKRQRAMRKAEKAAQKRERRSGEDAVGDADASLTAPPVEGTDVPSAGEAAAASTLAPVD